MVWCLIKHRQFTFYHRSMQPGTVSSFNTLWGQSMVFHPCPDSRKVFHSLGWPLHRDEGSQFMVSTLYSSSYTLTREYNASNCCLHVCCQDADCNMALSGNGILQYFCSPSLLKFTGFRHHVTQFSHFRTTNIFTNSIFTSYNEITENIRCLIYIPNSL
jgi:hypothetical protein